VKSTPSIPEFTIMPGCGWSCDRPYEEKTTAKRSKTGL